LLIEYQREMISDHKKKITLVLVTGVLLISILLFLGAVYVDDYLGDGRTYLTKQDLCRDFAHSYLKTVQKTDSFTATSNPEKWSLAVAIETDLYNLCLLDLDKESLGEFVIKNVQNYSTE